MKLTFVLILFLTATLIEVSCDQRVDKIGNREVYKRNAWGSAFQQYMKDLKARNAAKLRCDFQVLDISQRRLSEI